MSYHIIPTQITCSENAPEFMDRMIHMFFIRIRPLIEIKSKHMSFFLLLHIMKLIYFYTFWYQIEFEKCKIMYIKCTLYIDAKKKL